MPSIQVGTRTPAEWGDSFFKPMEICNRRKYALSFNTEERYKRLKRSYDYIITKNKNDMLHIRDMILYVVGNLETEPPLILYDFVDLIPYGIYRDALYAIINDYTYVAVEEAYLFFLFSKYEEFTYMTLFTEYK